MATIFRPIHVTRIWLRDPASAALRSQSEVRGNSNLYFPGASVLITTNRDQPNPRGPFNPSGVALSSQANVRNAVNLYFPITQATPATFNFDYPNPRGYTYPTDLRNYTAASFFDTSVLPSPNNDLPPPRGYQYPQNLRTFTQNAVRLYGTGILPYNQTDWPVPKGYTQPYENKTFIFSALPVLTLPPPPPPRTCYDWPNPRGYPYPTDLRVFVENLTYMLGTDQFFGQGAGNRLEDQPNPPRGYAYPTDLRTHINQVQRNLIGKDNIPRMTNMPGANIPNPIIAGRAFQNGTMQSMQTTLFPTGAAAGASANQLMMMGAGA